MNKNIRLLACLRIMLFIGLFSCSDSETSEVKFTISNQSNGFIDSLQIHIPSATTVVKNIAPQAYSNVVLKFNPDSIPKVDGSFLYSVYYKEGSQKQGNFGYYTNGWVDYFEKYELIIRSDTTIEARETK